IFFRHWNVLILVLLGIVGGGLFSLRAMPLESSPELTIPIGTVVTTYPGASPADMEKLVTDRLEERLKSLEDVTDLTSSSGEGVSSIIVEFDTSADLKDAIQKLKDEVDKAKSDLPADV